MLAVWLFVALWALAAVGLFFVAVRGGLGAAREALHVQTHGSRRAIGLTLTMIYLAFGVAVPVLILTGNNDKANGQVGGYKLTAADKQGRLLFGDHCAVCHTLAAANAIGKVGPNLDTLKAPASLVLHTLQYGCLQTPPTPTDPRTCLGQGTMPADIVSGRDAQNVAAFVAKVAGHE